MVAFLAQAGANGGKISGKRSLEAINAAKRTARATKASKAAAAARTAKAKQAGGPTFALPLVMSLRGYMTRLR